MRSAECGNGTWQYPTVKFSHLRTIFGRAADGTSASSTMADSNFLHLLKDSFGVIYFLSWSATFWPQVLLNHRRQSTKGLSHNYVAMASTGFVAYAVFTFFGYFSSTARAAYIDARGDPPPIELSDVLFAGHATCLSGVLILQSIYLRPGPRARKSVVIPCAAIVAAVLSAPVAAATGTMSWVTALEFCGMVKVLTSIVKHLPQAWENCARQSTVGWSFATVCLDIVGGGFSLAQQGVRCVIEGSWRPYTQNLSKLFLAGESLVFDFFFVVQHVCLYRDRHDPDVYAKLPQTRTEGEDAKDLTK